jgi:hypothetical protein
MDIDDTPVTIENRNRFWFPGPESSFEFDMRYHRGFIQIQQVVDLAIIRYEKKQKLNREPKPVETTTKKSSSSLFGLNFGQNFDDDDEDDSEEFLKIDETNVTTLAPATTTTKSETVDSTTELQDEVSTVAEASSFEVGSGDYHEIKKRSPQFDGLLGLLLKSASKQKEEEKFEVDNLKMYTKQFPYPKYVLDR